MFTFPLSLPSNIKYPGSFLPPPKCSPNPQYLLLDCKPFKSRVSKCNALVTISMS